MARTKGGYRSVNITRFFMKIVGCWYVTSKKEQMILRLAMIYAVTMVAIAIFIEAVDLYYCRDDFYAVTNNLCCSLLLVMILVKFGNFLVHWNLLLKLIQYAEEHFWNTDYEQAEAEILNDYDHRGMVMTYIFTIIVQLAVANHIVAPLIENINRNGTDRVLPFKLWINLPVTVSPYYEVLYIIESFSAYHCGICTFCYDNFVCTFNIHVAAQLKILAYQIRMIPEKYIDVVKRNEKISLAEASRYAFREMKLCIHRHKTLISYIENLQQAVDVLLLSQLLLSSMLICIGGFQILASTTTVEKCVFAFHFMGSLTQLLIYTWTCDDIIVQSSEISEAAYQSRWYILPHEGMGKAVKDGLAMIMVRARRPCKLSAGSFAVMSLETFTSVLSTSMSYFTLLREIDEDHE